MSKEEIDILLFVEHVARELDTACAVKHLLASRHGLRMEIASLAWGLGETLSRYQPAVVAMPYGYSSVDFGTHNILPVWPDAHYVNLAYEQVFQNIQKAHKAPRDKFAIELMLHHVWSGFAQKLLLDAGVNPRNIVVNGNPTYMLYCEPYRRYFESRSELAGRFGLDVQSRWVFVPENYGVAFLNDRQMRSRYGDFRGRQAESFRLFAKESFRLAAQWWCRAAKMDNTEVILRPRPATTKEKILQALQAAVGEIPPRLHVIKEATVRQWIPASDLVTSSYSTTLIEAAVADKPILMQAPLPFPDYLHADWYDYVPVAHSLEEFLQAVQSCDGSAGKSLREWAKREMLSRGDAIANIADLLAAVRRKERFAPGPPGIGILAIRPKEEPLKKIRGIASRIYHAFTRKPGKSWEADRITPEDVRFRLDKWARILG